MSNFNLNKVILGGRLAADPELKSTAGGISAVSVSMAVNRRTAAGKAAEADFFTLTAWRGVAEHLARYFKKGSSLCVVGHLEVRSFTDKQGAKRYVTEVVADEIYFVDAKGEAPAQAGVSRAGEAARDMPGQYAKGAQVDVTPPYSPGRSYTGEGDEELPF